MSLVLIVGVNDLLPATLGKSEETLHFRWRILEVVVHRDHVRPARMAQSRDYGVVLAEVAREVDEGHWHTRLFENRVKHFKTIISAAVIDEHDFVPAWDRKVLERSDKLSDAAGTIEDRNHDREGEARRGLRT